MCSCSNAYNTYYPNQQERNVKGAKLRTASWSSTSITSLLGLLIASPAEVISSGVDNNSAL
jgi:hypothetical protein